MNNLKHPLQFDLTLKRYSMTALLGYICDHPDIKEKMKEAKQNNRNPKRYPVKTIKKEIIKLASQKINALELPKNLIAEVQGILIFFAKKIATWSEFVSNVLTLDMSYLNRIYWTFFGTIDDAKIFDAYWRNHKSFSKIIVTGSDTTNKSLTSKMACTYANEEIIWAFRHSIIKEMKKFLKPISLPNIENKIDQIVATYLCYLHGGSYDMEHRTEIYLQFICTGNVDKTEIIFMCHWYPKPLKFLWYSLSDAEKERILFKLSKHHLNEALYYSSFNFEVNNGFGADTEIDVLGLGGYSEAVFFLMNQMSPVQLNQFLTENVSKVIRLFLQTWPYPEVCLKLLSEKWICDLIPSDGLEVLYILVFRMARDLTDLAYVSGTCQYPRVFHKILKIVLSLVSEDVKETVFFKKSYYSTHGKEFPYAIENFYYLFDLNALTLIINDEDLKKKRDTMIDMGSEKILKLIKKGNLKSVINFMEKVLTSNEERKNFIEKWDLRYYVLEAKNPDFQEKILNWLRG